MVLCTSLLMSACAESRSGRPTEARLAQPRRSSAPSGWTGSAWPSARTEAGQRYEVYATVVQGDEETILCLGAIASPSICFNSPGSTGKVPVTNWDWGRVEGEEVDSDVIWGEYHLLGTYDGTSFTVIRAGPRAPSSDELDDSIEIPCPKPEGGWVAPDPSRATEADLHAAGRYVDSQPDSAGYWIKYLNEEKGEASLDFKMNPYVLTAAFRRDIDRHRAELGAIWGGPLCVVQHSRTESELARIQEEVDSPGSESLAIHVLGSYTDVIHNQVVIEVVVFDTEAQAVFGKRYGVGAVRQVPSLIPSD